MFKKYIKNKNGYVDMITCIPIVIAIVLLMVFFLDLASYSQKYLAIRKTADSVLRIISLQGTLNTGVPSYIPGGDEEFWKNNEIKNFLEDIIEQTGLKNSNTVSITLDVERDFPNGNRIQNIDLLSGTSNVRIDYESNVTIKIKYIYKWALLGKVSNVGISRTVSSEYKHRNQGWSAGE